MKNERRYSIAESHNPDIQKLRDEIAEHTAAWVAINGEIKTSPIRVTSAADMKPGTFIIDNRRG